MTAALGGCFFVLFCFVLTIRFLDHFQERDALCSLVKNMFETCSDFFASFVSCFRTDAHAAPLRRQLLQGLAQARLVRYPVIQ